MYLREWRWKVVNKEKSSKISIIVPVYGTEQYLERCLNSLLNQSYKNIEIIVVNDGSPGNVAELMKSYENNSRIRFVNKQENHGLLRARVIGAGYAQGDYIAFVDSDDYVSFDYYRELITKAKETEAEIVIGTTVWENGEGRYIYNYHESALNFDRLDESEVKEAFFAQEYQCYSWHTVWNKLYQKKLWDRCVEEFETVKEHIIMTEDIYFSSILFFNARSVAKVNYSAYFYCENESASTNSNKITINRYLKNLRDIKCVFDKVYNYLAMNNASEKVLESVSHGRTYYANMWRKLADDRFEKKELALALEEVKKLSVSCDNENKYQGYFFESIKTPWDGGLEYIKETINRSKKEYVSFDIFDTLVKRPFYDPKDMMQLLDEPFSRLADNGISFSKIRIEAEDMARSYYGEKEKVEDITLDEIYEYIIKHYGISEDIAQKMKNLECENEVRFCEPRFAGKDIFQLAKSVNKHVVLITDMYLNRQTIEQILKKCGITGYEKLFISCEERCLKYNGRLFERALIKLNQNSDNMIHIGDTWRSDVEGSEKVGITNVFLPKAIEVFENKIQGHNTNRCSYIGKETCGNGVNYAKTMDNLGIRCMKAMAANYYFDNPYRSFHKNSDFNADPAFIGYYALGMHMLGISKWLEKSMDSLPQEHIVFLARDGYLPMCAYEAYCKEKNLEINVSYAQASRKAVMPFMIKDTVNLYQLPIEYRAHTSESLMKMLEFLSTGTDESFWDKLEKSGINRKKAFVSIAEYHEFINLFIQYCYSHEKHEMAKELVREYYKKLPENAIAFDMGYSGRIQAAICDAADKVIDVLFLHEDYKSSIRTKQYAGFSVYNFYEYYPAITGLLREHIFSDVKGSCIGFEKVNAETVPVIEQCRHERADQIVIEIMQKKAVTFVENFMNKFSDYACALDYSPMAASIPFEGFLREPSRFDMHIFSASYFEDMVFGANEKINIEQFVMNNLYDMGWIPKNESEIEEEKIRQQIEGQLHQQNDRILNLINTSSQLKRALVWMLLDWKFFKEKLNVNVNRLFTKRDKRKD